MRDGTAGNVWVTPNLNRVPSRKTVVRHGCLDPYDTSAGQNVTAPRRKKRAGDVLTATL